MTFNPDYVPFGANNRANEYYRKINNVKIAKNLMSRSLLLGEEPIFSVPLSATYASVVSSGLTQAAFNFPSVGTGLAGVGKRVLAIVASSAYSNPTPPTILLGGVAGTPLAGMRAPIAGNDQFIGAAIVEHEGAGDIAIDVTFPEAVNGVCISTFRIMGMSAAADEAPYYEQGVEGSAGVPRITWAANRRAGGITVAGIVCIGNEGTNFVGVTEVAQVAFGAPQNTLSPAISDDVADVAGDPVTCTWGGASGANAAGLLLTWGPGTLKTWGGSAP